MRLFIVALSRSSRLLLDVIVSLEHVLQLGGDLLEEADLVTEVMLHLRAEVPYPRAVEVLDFGQRGAGDDVAAVVELALLLWTVFHLGQSACWGGREGEDEGEPKLEFRTRSQPWNSRHLYHSYLGLGVGRGGVLFLFV